MFLRSAAVRQVDTFYRHLKASAVWLLTRPITKVVDMLENYKRQEGLRE
ncbi:MAG: hypothetical protein ABJO02_03705 [Reichenbachiella sp.]